MLATPMRVQISLLSLLLTSNLRARHEPIVAVFIDVGLDMSPRENFTASFARERAFHADLVTHINEQAGDVHEDRHGGRTAGRAGEVFGRAGSRPDSGVQAFLAKYMVAL